MSCNTEKTGPVSQNSPFVIDAQTGQPRDGVTAAHVIEADDTFALVFR